MQRHETLADALAAAKPHMTDEFGKMSQGALLLAAWALKRMLWSDVGVAVDETTPALVRKDPDLERGKRLCAPGALVEIAADKSTLGTGYIGNLLTGAGNIVHFYAVGSTGTLVERSPARFCGVVTGRFSYANSGGGTSHAVDAVGMFDLPENRKRITSAPPTLKPTAHPKTVSMDALPNAPAATPPAAPAAQPTSSARPAGPCSCAPGDLPCSMNCSTGQR